MSKKISVVIKRPGNKPYHTYVSNTLENLQRCVEGYIEFLQIGSDFGIIVNEEGRINDQPFNCTICGEQVFGPVVFVGIDGEDFTDMPGSFEAFKKVFNDLF